MGKKQRLVLAALLVTVVGGFAWLVSSQLGTEPVYQGKPLNFWLKGFNGDTNSVATKAFRAMGTNAIPILIERLRYKDPIIKAKLLRLANRNSFYEFSFRRDSDINLEAALALRVLGEQAKTALPQLEQLAKSKDEDTAVNSLLAMSYMGTEAIVPLTSALTNRSFYIQYAAIGALLDSPSVAIPEQRKAVALSLSRLLANSDASTREIITNFLLKIDPEAAAKAGLR